MRRWFVFLIAGLALGQGCGGGDEKPAPVVTATEDGQRIEVRDESGAHAVVAPDAGLPDGFPKDAVPLPEGAKVTTYLVDDVEGGRGFTLHLEVDDVAKAAASHRERLQRAGFKIENQQEAAGTDGGFESYQATSDAWEVTVIAAREPGSERKLMLLNVSPPDTAFEDDGMEAE